MTDKHKQTHATAPSKAETQLNALGREFIRKFHAKSFIEYVLTLDAAQRDCVKVKELREYAIPDEEKLPDGPYRELDF